MKKNYDAYMVSPHAARIYAQVKFIHSTNYIYVP